MSQNLMTDAFRRKLEESRAAEEAKAIPMVFEGFPCRVRVLPKLHFIRAGRMPDHLTKMLIARSDRGDTTPLEETAEQTVEGEIFMRKSVCAVMVEPRVVESEPVPEGGYLYADLEDAAHGFVAAVWRWIMQDCPLPEGEKKGGEAGTLSVSDLENFSEPAGGGAGVGDTGEGGGKGAVRTSAPRRKRTGRNRP